MTFGLNATASGSELPHSVQWRIPLLCLVFFSAAITTSGRSPQADERSAFLIQQEDTGDQTYYANAHPYIKEPLEQLTKLIPELETIESAQDQQALSSILEKTGGQVDEFFRKLIGLAAQEEITEEKLDGRSNSTSHRQVQNSYFIRRRGGTMLEIVDEYRIEVEAKKNTLDKGYLLTSNFALNRMYFGTARQSESTFVYLGQEKIGSHDTYVVAFAQNPGQGTLTVQMSGQKGSDSAYVVNMLVQGIAWVDTLSFQIIQLRTDLLAPRNEINLDRFTTTVTFSPVQILGVPLWLPSNVVVYAKFTEFDISHGLNRSVAFRNDHHYTNYQASGGLVPPGYVARAGENDPTYYANAHPYLEESLETLEMRFPDLRKIHPAANQQVLPGILENTGANVDGFFRHIVDLIAQEKINQEKWSRGEPKVSERVQDNYLILRRRSDVGADIVEYFMDADGNELDLAGLEKGYLVTSGFALSCNYFSTVFQPESRFRFLGDQRIGKRDTYVVAFAQKPGVATVFVTMTERGGARVRMLMQGIAWVDKSNFQIIRIRTNHRPLCGYYSCTWAQTIGFVGSLPDSH